MVGDQRNTGNVCYADDILALVRVHSFEEVLDLAKLWVVCVVQKISGLGLQVAPYKMRMRMKKRWRSYPLAY